MDHCDNVMHSHDICLIGDLALLSTIYFVVIIRCIPLIAKCILNFTDKWIPFCWPKHLHMCDSWPWYLEDCLLTQGFQSLELFEWLIWTFKFLDLLCLFYKDGLYLRALLALWLMFNLSRYLTKAYTARMSWKILPTLQANWQPTFKSIQKICVTLSSFGFRISGYLARVHQVFLEGNNILYWCSMISAIRVRSIEQLTIPLIK